MGLIVKLQVGILWEVGTSELVMSLFSRIFGKGRHFVIHEGRGVGDKFILSEHSWSQVRAIVGHDYKQSGWDLSFEAKRSGLSFRFEQQHQPNLTGFDGRYLLSSIGVGPPSTGTTERGIELGKDSLNSVLSKYGVTLPPQNVSLSELL
jgi:hypothetical protein